jgi:hypothetical protein
MKFRFKPFDPRLFSFAFSILVLFHTQTVIAGQAFGKDLDSDLWDAINRGDLVEARQLVMEGADPNAFCPEITPSSLFHNQIWAGDHEAVRLLIQCDADVTSIDPEDGLTPLHMAVVGFARETSLSLRRHYFIIMAELIAAGASPDAPIPDFAFFFPYGNAGQTPEDFAVMYDVFEEFQQAVSKGNTLRKLRSGIKNMEDIETIFGAQLALSTTGEQLKKHPILFEFLRTVDDTLIFEDLVQKFLLPLEAHSHLNEWRESKRKN